MLFRSALGALAGLLAACQWVDARHLQQASGSRLCIVFVPFRTEDYTYLNSLQDVRRKETFAAIRARAGQVQQSLPTDTGDWTLDPMDPDAPAYPGSAAQPITGALDISNRGEELYNTYVLGGLELALGVTNPDSADSRAIANAVGATPSIPLYTVHKLCEGAACDALASDADALNNVVSATGSARGTISCSTTDDFVADLPGLLPFGADASVSCAQLSAAITGTCVSGTYISQGAQEDQFIAVNGNVPFPEPVPYPYIDAPPLPNATAPLPAAAPVPAVAPGMAPGPAAGPAAGPAGVNGTVPPGAPGGPAAPGTTGETGGITPTPPEDFRVPITAQDRSPSTEERVALSAIVVISSAAAVYLLGLLIIVYVRRRRAGSSNGGGKQMTAYGAGGYTSSRADEVSLTGTPSSRYDMPLMAGLGVRSDSAGPGDLTAAGSVVAGGASTFSADRLSSSDDSGAGKASKLPPVSKVLAGGAACTKSNGSMRSSNGHGSVHPASGADEHGQDAFASRTSSGDGAVAQPSWTRYSSLKHHLTPSMMDTQDSTGITGINGNDGSSFSGQIAPNQFARSASLSYLAQQGRSSACLDKGSAQGVSVTALLPISSLIKTPLAGIQSGGSSSNLRSGHTPSRVSTGGVDSPGGSHSVSFDELSSMDGVTADMGSMMNSAMAPARHGPQAGLDPVLEMSYELAQSSSLPRGEDRQSYRDNKLFLDSRVSPVPDGPTGVDTRLGGSMSHGGITSRIVRNGSESRQASQLRSHNLLSAEWSPHAETSESQAAATPEPPPTVESRVSLSGASATSLSYLPGYPMGDHVPASMEPDVREPSAP